MNKKLLFGAVVSSLILFSCGEKKEVTYNSHSSIDNTYSVDIPSDALPGKCIGDFMSFSNEDTHLIITINHIAEESIYDYFRQNDPTKDSFSYDLFQSSDTSYFYKVTRGNNMWSAYDLYMLKRLDGKNYLIHESSDIYGQSKMIEMINHIYSSMKKNEKEINDDVSKNTEGGQADLLEKTYSTKYYCIKYPQGWRVLEHLDAMTDVYVGNPQDNFGFTIVRFETNASLSEANAEGKENLRQAGFIIKENKQMTVNGVKCFRSIQEISIGGQKSKLISYLIKKDDMLYDVKFGSVTTKSHEILAADIIDTFHFL